MPGFGGFKGLHIFYFIIAMDGTGRNSQSAQNAKYIKMVYDLQKI